MENLMREALASVKDYTYHCSCTALLLGVDHVRMRRAEAIALNDVIRMLAAVAPGSTAAAVLAQQQEALLKQGAADFSAVMGVGMHGSKVEQAVMVPLVLLKPYLKDRLRGEAMQLLPTFPFAQLTAAVGTTHTLAPFFPVLRAPQASAG